MKAKHILSILLLTFLSMAVSAQNIGDYRTTASGAWTNAAIWESYDGVSWIAASSVPSYLSGVMTIRAPHIISLPGGTLDQVVVDSGATVNQAGWVLMENGLGADLQINGTWNMASGYLYGPGVALVNGTFNWDGGDVGAPGYITASFSYLRINATGILNLNGTSQKNIERGKIESFGTTKWNGGLINMTAFTGVDTTSFVNHGMFYVGAGNLNMNIVTDPRFINSSAGAFIKSTTGTVTIGNMNFSFYNYGLQNVTNGIFMLSGGATLNNFGIIEANSPGAYNGTSTAMYCNNMIKGNAFIAMGYLYIGGAITVDTLATVTHNSGYLYVPGELTIHGIYNITAGDIGAPSYIYNGLSQVQTSAVGTLNFNGSTAKTITRAQVTNYGTSNWNGGDLSLNTISTDTTKFINVGVFNLGTGALNLFGQAPARFINAASGIMNKSTTGTTTIQGGSYFQNFGLINISDGTFSTNNQNASFHNYSTILCPGSGPFNGQWNVNLYAGSFLTGNGTYTANGNWIIRDATMADTTATISQSGENVYGPGLFTIHGTYNLSAGSMRISSSLSQFIISHLMLAFQIFICAFELFAEHNTSVHCSSCRAHTAGLRKFFIAGREHVLHRLYFFFTFMRLDTDEHLISRSKIHRKPFYVIANV